MILAACRQGARRVLACIGGSATNDGGAGMAQALGVRLTDREGRDLRSGGAALLDLARIDMSGLDPAVKRAEFVVATDVDNPLVGPQGASAVYGPQKGASPEDVALIVSNGRISLSSVQPQLFHKQFRVLSDCSLDILVVVTHKVLTQLIRSH